MLKVKLVRSMIGCNPNQRATLKALGLRKIRQEKSFDDSPVVRGMIRKVEHLVEVTES
ncbi:50S ribosomal protein L30 [Maridesulfovibrio sp. FT414]|uniref:50S ribosomal protein L30 n=1 Tax=Maridesulfovibrio sp. FT414 TaxID=2979469 RepID=UPI003D803102